MGCKEVMVLAPLLVMLYDRAFRVDSWRALMARDRGRPAYYSALAATAVLGIALIATTPRSSSVGFGLGLSWWEYFETQGWAIWRYLRLAVWPSSLSIDYGPAPVVGIASVAGLVGLAALAVATLAAWTRADRFGWLAFLGSWFFVILAPSSSFVPITTEVAAERRMYLPLVAVIALIGVGALRVAVTPRWRIRVVALAATVWAALALLTARRSATFADLEALWREAARNAPLNARAPDNLATVIAQSDPRRAPEAERALRRALERDSTDGAAWYKLGLLAVNDGRMDSARVHFERALAINPRHPDVLAELGSVYLHRGDTTRGVELLERAAARSRNDTTLIRLAQVYAAKGRPEDALDRYRRALSANPNRTDVARYVARSLLEAGRVREAEELLARAALMTQDAETLTLLAVAKLTLGDRDAAIALLRRALQVDPGYAPAASALARLQ
jgi:Tfp pilus assembly protein PilF